MMPFLRCWLQLVAFLTVMAAVGLAPTGLGWLVVRATDNAWAGLAVAMLVLTFGLAALNWWGWQTPAGDRLTRWMTQAMTPPDRRNAKEHL